MTVAKTETALSTQLGVRVLTTSLARNSITRVVLISTLCENLLDESSWKNRYFELSRLMEVATQD